jgi:hypothetical protein
MLLVTHEGHVLSLQAVTTSGRLVLLPLRFTMQASLLFML